MVVNDGSFVLRGISDALTGTPCGHRVIASDVPELVRSAGDFGAEPVVIMSKRTYVVTLATTEFFNPDSGTLARVLLLCEPAHPPELLGHGTNVVRGYLSVDATEAQLFAAVQAVSQGGLYLPVEFFPLLSNVGAPAAERPRVGTVLTDREESVLRHVARGLTHKQVATRLGLTKSTVDSYVYRIRQKLQVGNKADLTRKAGELGLLDAHA